MNQPSMVKARLDNDYNDSPKIVLRNLLCVLWAWPRFRLTRHALLGCWATPAGHQLTNKERGSQALAA